MRKIYGTALMLIVRGVTLRIYVGKKQCAQSKK